jgi:hypothetical protein
VTDAHRALAPGDGDAPIGVEMFSDAWAARPLSETAQQMATAARGILDASR